MKGTATQLPAAKCWATSSHLPTGPVLATPLNRAKPRPKPRTQGSEEVINTGWWRH